MIGALLSVTAPAYGQTGTISGAVTDSLSGETLPGVNVVIQGTSQGAATDAEGNYSITGLEPGEYTLQASFVGYKAKTVEGVQVTSGETTEVNIELTADSYQLDEVVAVGYGQQEREDLTGAVSSVSGEDISELPVSGIEQALQGRAPGVDIRPSSGEPGAAALVKVRGATTIGSPNPLYVIDGMPVVNEETSYGQPNPLSLLNPNNIESVEVLKDASATAIYGSRAANGVVLIQTERGEQGDTRVSFDLSGGVKQFGNTFEMLNSEQWARMVNDASEAAGEDPPELTQNPENLDRSTDWQEEAFELGSVQDYNLSISGGNEAARFAVSGGYLNDQGTLPESHYKRYNVRINSNYDITPNLNVSQSALLARSNWEGGKAAGTDLTEMLLQAPTMPVRCPENEGGFCGPTQENAGYNARSNTLGQMYLVENTETQSRVLGNAQIEYDFHSNLSLSTNLGVDYIFSETLNFTPTWEMAARSNTLATLSQSSNSQRTLLVEPLLTYDDIINEVHSLSATLGYTQQEEISEFITGNKEEFPSNDLRTINAGQGGATLQGARSEWAVRSVFGRVNYGYDSKYLLTATLRRDGSSRFGPESRWGNFPSFSLAWRLSEEPFMEDVPGLTSLKLRAGWGRVGNQSGIGNYDWWATIEPVADYIIGDELATGATYLELGNQNLSWESTEQLNIGTDATLLDGRLSLTANYYQKDTQDLLLRVPINTTSGIFRNSGPVTNAGGMRNSGVELETTYSGGGTEGGLQYTVSANVTTVNNEVTNLGEGQSAIIANPQAEEAQALTYTAEGGELGAHYGWVMDGLFDSQQEVDQHADQPGAAPGDVKYRDLNNDGVIDDADRKVIGSPFPDFTYGVSAEVTYNRFSISAFIDGVQGRDIYNLQKADLMDLTNFNNNRIEAADRWRPDNQDTNVPRAVADDPNDNRRPSTRFLEDGSYLRLSRIQVGYGFDVPNVLNQQTSRMRVYAAGQNLYTFSGYSGWNPDIGAAGNPALTNAIDDGVYPITRQWNVGLQVTF